ncbi:hypothetical protein TWF102_003976 [Orbilia oligospora]|uniref:Uncharacterized protein n=1 Tax=Orbilia oligospora TaxID=2813651 RepID=A0A7C8NEB3_ORBOL|nr:hypothetical protein TWF103_009594 [Orbilia oligospora]KAF3103162.1 hypothetical protein TWF102_003976 [Orbilia oligospora]
MLTLASIPSLAQERGLQRLVKVKERNGKHQARRTESEIVIVTVDTYVRAVQKDGQTTQGNGHQYNGSSEGLRLPFLGEPDKAGRQDNKTPHFSSVEYTTGTPYGMYPCIQRGLNINTANLQLTISQKRNFDFVEIANTLLCSLLRRDTRPA